jgi:hypothetical protein
VYHQHSSYSETADKKFEHSELFFSLHTLLLKEHYNQKWSEGELFDLKPNRTTSSIALA